MVKPREEVSGWPKLTVQNAISYLQEVEKILPTEKFLEFLEVIEDFKHNRISTKVVVGKVRSMLEGKSRKLISGFNMFLPPEFHIKPEKFSIAIELVKKIRDRFEKDEPKLLHEFIDILGRFQTDTISLPDTRALVQTLFDGHTDILADFDVFLQTSSNVRDKPEETVVAEEDEESDALSDVSASSHRYTQDELDQERPAVTSKASKTQPKHKGHSRPAKPQADKRKATDGDDHGRGETGGDRAVRRRLVTIGRLQHIAMSKGAWGAGERGHQRARKQVGPVARRERERRGVLSADSLPHVLPSSTLQRVQAVLRAMQASGTSGQYGAFPSFLCRP